MKLPYLSVPVRLALFLAIATVLTDWALAAEFQRTFSFDSKELLVANMIGQVEVVQGSTDEFKITAHVQGKDAEEGLLEFLVDEGSKGSLVVAFPIDDHRKYVYPALGSGSQSQFHYHNEGDNGGSWLKKVFSGMSGKKITVKGKGNGLELWVDLKIEVPRGRVLEMRQRVGTIDAHDLTADLNFDTSSGGITVRDMAGDLVADTGSGNVKAEGVKGTVYADTGSGQVTLADIEGSQVVVDTGSGSVGVRMVRCKTLHIDTGSGEVDAQEVSADAATIDTGSGSVHLQLDRMGEGKFAIDTGSGSITLEMPENPSAHVYADTGSGQIRADLDGATIHAEDDDELELTVGEGATRVVLDAGSGSITVK